MICKQLEGLVSPGLGRLSLRGRCAGCSGLAEYPIVRAARAPTDAARKECALEVNCFV